MVITGISKNALQLIADGGFKKTTRGVVRGHKISRISRGELLFGDKRVDYQEAFDFYRKNDQCVLITKSENGVKVNPKKEWSPIFQFNQNDWVFPWRSSGYSAYYSNEALEYLKNIARINSIT